MERDSLQQMGHGSVLFTSPGPLSAPQPPPAQEQSPCQTTRLPQKHCLDILKQWQNKRLQDLGWKISTETMKFNEKY